MSQGILMEWPYPIRYFKENEVTTDVLILGGGIAGCWAAIAAAKRGVRVVIVEKADTVISGSGGAGCDHWVNTPNPCSGLTAQDMIDLEVRKNGGYCNGVSHYISARESFDTLLELEKMGAKIRDDEDEFKGADFRDEETKFLFCFDYVNKFNFRVWGAGTKNAPGFKPALYKECLRLGISIYNRVQTTSLLTEGGEQGGRVVGAIGLSVRTGEFYIFKSKATIMCLSRPQRIWRFMSELSGFPSTRPHTCIGNGHAMAWRAGAEFTLMEKSWNFNGWTDTQGYPNIHCQSGEYSAYACSIVDAKGKEVAWVDRDGKILKTIAERYRPSLGQRFMANRTADYEHRLPHILPDVAQRVRKGEFALPFYVDLPGIPDHERRVIWGMMIGQEGKTKWNTIEPYRKAGFDPSKHQPQNYDLITREPMEWWQDTYRRFGEYGECGGLIVDWNFRTNLEGLYAAGDQLFASESHNHAAATGRYAGRRAAEYVLRAKQTEIARRQVDDEKIRVYAPTKLKDGICWKELNAGSAMIMSKYCGSYKNEELMKMGLWALKRMEEEETSAVYASDPHKLGRTLDVLDLITVCQMILHASLARKGSSRFLNFFRLDYPGIDSLEWQKFISIREDQGKVKVGELPMDFWGSLKQNYDDHNKGYVGLVKE